jgi:hypothetical protein
MTTKEIKVDIFGKLDALKGSNLTEAYGILLNYVNGINQEDEWEKLSNEEKAGIQWGLDQLDKGETKSHKAVMEAVKLKYHL